MKMHNIIGQENDIVRQAAEEKLRLDREESDAWFDEDWQDQRAKVKAILDQAQRYHHTKIGIDSNTGDYLWATVFTSDDQLPVGAKREPIVAAPEWGLGNDNILTVNHYNALILNSRTLLMLDIDFGDRRFNKWVIGNTQELIEHMQDLPALDKKCRTDWAAQSWRIYQTAHGARLICLTRPWPLNYHNSHHLRSLGQFLGADPLYVQKCIEGQSYRARLTPKGPRELCVASWAAQYPYGSSNCQIHPDIKAPLSLHDAIAHDFRWDEKLYYDYEFSSSAREAALGLVVPADEGTNQDGESNGTD